MGRTQGRRNPGLALAKPSESKARERRARVTDFRAHPDAVELVEIGRLIDRGGVEPHVMAVYPLDQAAEAQRRIEREQVHGKVVLRVA